MMFDLERMITAGRAEKFARLLFPDEIHSGDDCRAEIGREGQPCSICAMQAEAWEKRKADVRAAMIEAFR